MNSVIFVNVMKYIDEHIHEKINLADLSDIAGYSPFYFSKLFSEAVGMPVTGYIRIRKLQYAIVSLLEGHKVLDVALMYAFDSHEGFTRSFVRLFGSTPSTVRKQLSSYRLPDYPIIMMKGNNKMDNNKKDLALNMHQLVYEFIKQSIEEAKEGFCTRIEVTLLSKTKICIHDNGRGLPLSTDLQARKLFLRRY